MDREKSNFVQLVRPDYENINQLFAEIEDDLNESEMRTFRKVKAILELMERKHRRNVENAKLAEKVMTQ